MAKLEASSKNACCKERYKVEMDNDGNLLPVDVFRKLFLNTSREQLARSLDKCLILKHKTKEV